jgi:hypothetical protein
MLVIKQLFTFLKTRSSIVKLFSLSSFFSSSLLLSAVCMPYHTYIQCTVMGVNLFIVLATHTKFALAVTIELFESFVMKAMGQCYRERLMVATNGSNQTIDLLY